MRNLLAVLFLAFGAAAYADEVPVEEVAVAEEVVLEEREDAEVVSADLQLVDPEQAKSGCGCGGKPKA